MSRKKKFYRPLLGRYPGGLDLQVLATTKEQEEVLEMVYKALKTWRPYKHGSFAAHLCDVEERISLAKLEGKTVRTGAKRMFHV